MENETGRRDESGSADDCPIEITPEMVEAGYSVLARAGLGDALLEADRLTVAEIYLAMRRLELNREAH